MKFYLSNKTEITLTQADFKAAGGQGSVYVKGATAYKVYADPQQMIPRAKLQELSALTQTNIIRPLDVIYDPQNNAVGYTMRHVEDAYALCQLFPKAFRQRTNLTPEVVLQLVHNLQASVRHIHQQNILLVDLNEMNFLVADDFHELYFIDVDSYQTPSFPATALMESVRDRHAKQFDERSDWFSFAVVSFQMFIGIHPYKGSHKKLTTMDARMRANVSVLNPAVTVPSACLPFDVIPTSWRDWYKAVLEDGKRLPPPEDVQAAITLATIQVQPQTGSHQFVITKLFELDDEILSHVNNLTITKTNIYAGGKRVDSLPCPDAKITITLRQHHVIAVWLEGNQLRVRNLSTGVEVPADVRGERLMMNDGRIYMKAGASLSELTFIELPNKLLVAAKLVGNVLPNATQLFDGVAMQNLLGAYYASFFPASGVCYQARLKELDGYQIIDAKAERNVLIVIAAKSGAYDKFIFRFGENFADYDVRVCSDVTLTDINFAVLASGVCLHLNDRDELELFANRKGSSELKVISDPAICGNDKLFSDGHQALIARGNTLYRIAMSLSG
ncbi:MAG: serine/threonine protein kinase [Acidobacteria bacterium]|nr:serine/threonine protein kinase [Acidobacteriota bacterium]